MTYTYYILLFRKINWYEKQNMNFYRYVGSYVVSCKKVPIKMNSKMWETLHSSKWIKFKIFRTMLNAASQWMQIIRIEKRKTHLPIFCWCWCWWESVCENEISVAWGGWIDDGGFGFSKKLCCCCCWCRGAKPG